MAEKQTNSSTAFDGTDESWLERSIGAILAVVFRAITIETVICRPEVTIRRSIPNGASRFILTSPNSSIEVDVFNFIDAGQIREDGNWGNPTLV